jgi:hypothetical protein
LRESGAHLLEVGTTNRVHLNDYESAIEQGAQLLLLTHHSNFKIVGFATEPSMKELSGLAIAAGVPLIFDQGSGALLDTGQYGLPHEITVQEALQAGADLVCFSGINCWAAASRNNCGKRSWWTNCANTPFTARCARISSVLPRSQPRCATT